MEKEKGVLYVGAIDQGTTSTRFIIYDQHANHVASHQVELTQFYPEAGWVEHDPMEILESVRVCMAKALHKATADGHNVDGGIKVIGITNQRETTIVWSKSSGCPLHNAIVWMDARTSTNVPPPILILCQIPIFLLFLIIFHSSGNTHRVDFWILFGFLLPIRSSSS